MLHEHAGGRRQPHARGRVLGERDHRHAVTELCACSTGDFARREREVADLDARPTVKGRAETALCSAACLLPDLIGAALACCSKADPGASQLRLMTRYLSSVVGSPQ